MPAPAPPRMSTLVVGGAFGEPCPCACRASSSHPELGRQERGRPRSNRSSGARYTELPTSRPGGPRRPPAHFRTGPRVAPCCPACLRQSGPATTRDSASAPRSSAPTSPSCARASPCGRADPGGTSIARKPVASPKDAVVHRAARGPPSRRASHWPQRRSRVVARSMRRRHRPRQGPRSNKVPRRRTRVRRERPRRGRPALCDFGSSLPQPLQTASVRDAGKWQSGMRSAICAATLSSDTNRFVAWAARRRRQCG